MTTSNQLLSVQNLTTKFRTDDGIITAVDDVSFDMDPGETLCIVGESGSGKSVTALSLMRLIPKSNGLIDSSSQIVLEGQDLLQLGQDDMRDWRGDRIAMIFQEPMTALNPVYTIGEQIAEVFRIHRGMSKKEAIKASIGILEQVKIPDAHQRVHEYPHQMSGGMRQRVLIAMALACKPTLLIADEPSTALDVTVQAQILKLMKDLQKQLNTAILFITHDLGVVAEIADRVLVMYAGQVIERATVTEIYRNPLHPYTKGLLQSIPTLDSTPKEELSTIEGVVPSLADLPSGCRFHDRCPFAEDACTKQTPQSRELSPGHFVSCLRAEEIAKND